MMPSLEGQSAEQKLNWYRGAIISAATVIEKALGWKLRTFFFPKANAQAAVFYQSILNTQYFNFDRKITVYKQVPYFKKLKNYTEIIHSLAYVQQLRNAVAHWEAFEDGTSADDEVLIYNPITFQKRKLSPKTMSDFIEHDKRLLKAFGWHYTLEGKYGVKNKSKYNRKRDAEISAMARLLSKYNHIR